MSIAPRSSAAVTQVGTASFTWTANLPTYSAGDLVVMTVGSSVGSTSNLAVPSGWTGNPARTLESSGLQSNTFTRLMDGTEGSTVGLTFTGGSAPTGVVLATAFTGVDPSTPIDAAGLCQAEPSSTAQAAHTTPSITTVTDGAVLVSSFVTDQNCAWSSTDTELGDSTSGSSYATSQYYSAPVTVGSYTRTGTASAASVRALSSILALRPAAASGSPQSMLPVAIDTLESWGSPTVTVAALGQGMSPVAIDTLEQWGSPTVSVGGVTQAMAPVAIDTLEQWGTPTVTIGTASFPQTISPVAIDPLETWGSPTVTFGTANVTVNPVAIEPQETWGNPTITVHAQSQYLVLPLVPLPLGDDRLTRRYTYNTQKSLVRDEETGQWIILQTPDVSLYSRYYLGGRDYGPIDPETVAELQAQGLGDLLSLTPPNSSGDSPSYGSGTYGSGLYGS